MCVGGCIMDELDEKVPALNPGEGFSPVRCRIRRRARQVPVARYVRLVRCVGFVALGGALTVETVE